MARLAESNEWSNGATTRPMAVTETGNYSVTVTDNTSNGPNTTEPITIAVDA